MSIWHPDATTHQTRSTQPTLTQDWHNSDTYFPGMQKERRNSPSLLTVIHSTCTALPSFNQHTMEKRTQYIKTPVQPNMRPSYPQLCQCNPMIPTPIFISSPWHSRTQTIVPLSWILLPNAKTNLTPLSFLSHRSRQLKLPLCPPKPHACTCPSLNPACSSHKCTCTCPIARTVDRPEPKYITPPTSPSYGLFL